MIADAAQALAVRWRETTPRERAAMAILAAIAAVTTAIYALEWSNTSASDANAAARAVADVQAVQATVGEPTYRRRLSVVTGDLYRWSHTSDAFGGEEALAEIESLALQAGFVDPAVALVEQAQTERQVQRLQVSVSAAFDWNAYLAFLEQLEDADVSLSIDSIDVTEEEGAQRIMLLVSAPLIDTREAR